MATQAGLQDLLRMFTSRKIPMLSAMKHIQALQVKGLKSIDQIADGPSSTLEEVLGDAKLAKNIQTACKSHGRNPPKRPLSDDATPSSSSPPTKKPNLGLHKHDIDYASISPDELEASLTLPPLVQDEALIRATTSIVTNRAPLLLAFAYELLNFTMPEQPPSSRLSLAQAVVSANSRSKAASLGIEKENGMDGISQGQPKVRMMGREVPVLKRGGYSWSGTKSTGEAEGEASSSAAAQVKSDATTPPPSVWKKSQKLNSKSSTFIAHSANISSPSQRKDLIKTLMEENPTLETATHNAWAVRASYGNSPLVQEASFDDGETGCGKFMLEIMREGNISNKIVVISRWFGGVLLGQDRWRLMKECINDSLSARQRTSELSGEALWALDLSDKKQSCTTIGMAIHRPEGARNYLLKSFTSTSAEAGGSGGKKTAAAMEEEKQENLGRLLGALRMLFSSWEGVLKGDELDRRAWSWYVAVRPEVDAGPGGWGAKGTLDLGKILDLRRKGM